MAGLIRQATTGVNKYSACIIFATAYRAPVKTPFWPHDSQQRRRYKWRRMIQWWQIFTTPKGKFVLVSDMILLLLLSPFIVVVLVILCSGVAIGRWLGLLDEDEGL